MNPDIATEISYKNGYSAGKQNSEITTRVEVAYEQLAACYTSICKNANRADMMASLVGDFDEVLSKLAAIKVKLGYKKEGL